MYCSFVDENIVIRVSNDAIPRVLRWKVILEATRQSKVEKVMFGMTTCKFSNICASTKELSMLMLPDERDYKLKMLAFSNGIRQMFLMKVNKK